MDLPVIIDIDEGDTQVAGGALLDAAGVIEAQQAVSRADALGGPDTR
jgi:hypothetical protein